MSTIILGIESSCDDTSASVIKNSTIFSNVVAGQSVHEDYGGVVPELASRAHQQNIIPVVHKAMKDAGVNAEEVDAVAFTRGPGLMGSLLVGASFAKGFALARRIPLIEVDHLQAHVLAHFIQEPEREKAVPSFPFLCLLVSGGNSQIILVKSHLEMEIIGQTIDDAAGEAFDKYAQKGNPDAFQFSKPRIAELNYSFSGLKTSFLYFLRDQMKMDPDFISNNTADLCASLQRTIVEILMEKLIKASRETGIREVALAGGVSANSGLRTALADMAEKKSWKTYIPKLSYTTDNAAMIAITGYYKFLKGEFAGQDAVPYARGK
jgi:N6-L-threonylcarbamoyladenine synthase